ncbi:acyltransferase [Nocardiopsis sp. TSRI0078]|uniref:acyltransferase family protein n=1 Tax=unclassified Nocardiopsis TaxID=2649073 RepID=UPI00093EE50E|nr:acyltransferase family protein [Nocardiopsis sp. TSRI0078]OKI23849.1 acyltransferase [Nocardiopsis sp. TSRI0078]
MGGGTSVPQASPPAAKRGYRPEIEGLRAVAVLLVAVYHIWFGKVSGGVDVFLLLTGFLITGSLVRALERGTGVAFRAFWARLAKRLFPAAAVVMAGVLVASFLWMPRSRWSDIIADVFASALYYQNWHLALGAVDYLAENDAGSPLQHFWSLAIQGQFYLLWPTLLAITGLIAARVGLSVRNAALVAVATVFAVSFSHSLFVTASDPAWAYFDGAARVWELALGGILALTISRVRLPYALRVVLGWVGLVAFVLCGALVPVSVSYPGFIALWPTGAAILVLLAGTTGSRVAADRFLTWRPVVYVGGLSYALFLWHWPVLVFYLEVTERVRASVVGGFYVLALSSVLAFLTKKLVEGNAERLASLRPGRRVSFAVGALFLVPVLIAAGAWDMRIDRGRELRETLASDTSSYPGALALVDEETAAQLPALPVHPDTADARTASLERIYECHARIPQTEMVSCDFGPEDAERTIALVGSSHAIHWMEGLREVTEANGWRLVTFTKDVCQFSAAVEMRQGEVYSECEEWKTEQMERLRELRPDAVFTTSTRSQASPGEEYVPEGYVERWREMDELGIDVIAVRDTPRLDFVAPECVDKREAEECVTEVGYGLAEESPLESIADVPGNVRSIDLTEQLCPRGTCAAVIGNQLAYYDKSHFTYSFSRSLSWLLEPAILEVTGW